MILLTGARGFLGTHLLNNAKDRFIFRCLVRQTSKISICLPSQFETIQGDLLDTQALDRATQGIDTVLHMAALIRNQKPQEIRRVNIDGTRLLLESAKRNHVRRFIYISTENALREDLDDAYADSKRQAEALVRQFRNHLILRPCFVFGPGDDHGLARLLKMVDRWPIIGLFAGMTSKIQPIYIDDMTGYLIRALATDIQGEYLIGGRDRTDLNTLLKQICVIRKKKRLLVPIPYALWKLSAKLCGPFSVLGWGKAQLRNIYHSRTYSIDKTIEDFNFSPRPLMDGMREWLGS